MIEIFRPFIILLGIFVLAVPGIMMSIGQRQDTSAFGQLTLAQQAPALSQQQQVLNNTNDNNTNSVPILNDSKLRVELVTDGLDFPTSMAFIGNHGDLLISEKGGRVTLFSNENSTKIPLGNFSVNQQSERGLLGVAVLANHNMSNASTTTPTTATTNNSERIPTSDNGIRDANAASASTPTYVYFYLTDATTGNASQILGNRIYRFEWNDTDKSLSNRTLILDLPATPGPNHNGGKLIADSENGHIYAVIG
ncbi:MAG TPA: hypothetical protein VJ695_10385, partial [Nitrososphaera sp.]|nr:hypothetical protein [Nitrososphaera sp.]